MTTHPFEGERVTLTTSREFSDVVAHVERDGAVQISYDRVASVLAPYGDPHALQVARDLDAKVEGLLCEAAGQAAPAKAP